MTALAQQRVRLLEMENVTKTYGHDNAAITALDRVNLTVHAGEFVAVMGPSGSGKSTLLALAGGLDRADEGKIFVSGAPLQLLSLGDKARLRRREIGFIFQDYSLFPTLTAAENIALPLELDGMKPAQARKEAVKAMAEIGIKGLEDRFVEELSGGQQQRVAIARATVGEKKIILADEPTGALDTVAGEEILTLLRQRADAGSAVILVTHDPRDAGWADTVVYLRDGQVVDYSQMLANDGGR